MNVYHYNPDTGVYVGPGKADESPLEDNVWLIPANSTDIEPPVYSELTEYAVYVDGSWIIQPIPEPEEEPFPESPPIPDIPPPEQVELEPHEKRRAAYVAEADPLFFKAQRGTATMEDWLAKVAEIQALYPDV